MYEVMQQGGGILNKRFRKLRNARAFIATKEDKYGNLILYDLKADKQIAKALPRKVSRKSKR